MGFAEMCALVADDEQHVRDELAEQLAGFHLVILRAGDRDQVMTQVQEYGGEVEVAVLDLVMPGDGMEAAQQLQAEHPHIAIIFLTAHGSEYRARARELGLQVVAWIDKGADYLDRTVSAVLEVIRERRLVSVRGEVRSWAQGVGVPRDQAQELLDRLHPTLQRLFIPSARYVTSVPVGTPKRWEPFRAPEGSDWPLEDVLGHLRLLLEELRSNYEDVADRELFWQALRGFLASHLWKSVESAGTGAAREQLADQLDRAVEQIDSHQLTTEIVGALEMSLQRLASTEVTVSDVHECELAWRSARISTLPSFEALLGDWNELYGTEPEGGE